MNTVCIIGANRGIGLALVRAYAQRGDNVLAVCRKSAPELESLDVEVITDVNVVDNDAVSSLQQRLQKRNIDLLVHNAGILLRDTWAEQDEASIRLQFEVNTLGPLRTVRALKDNLKSGAKVAVITSRMGSIEDNTSGGYYGYRISKAGVNMVVKCLSIDLQPEGIAVGVFHPGYVKTDMTGNRGDVSTEACAQNLVQRFDDLSLETTGAFFHAKGEPLPW